MRDVLDFGPSYEGPAAVSGSGGGISDRSAGAKASTCYLPEVALKLAKPLERAVREGHPWVYREAVRGEARPGEVTDLLDRKGRFLARGVAEEGPLALRVWTLQDEELGPDLLRDRLLRAHQLRSALDFGDTTAWRMVHGEGDRIPGVVVDRYEDFAVLRLDGAVAKLPWLIDVLWESLRDAGVKGLLGKERRGEGGVRELRGERAPDPIRVRERGMVLEASLWRGQKTGLFLDHRESRARVRQLSAGRRVLNLYGYTGGFSIAAGLGDAREVVTVDVAKPAIAMAEASWAANDLPDAHTGRAIDARAFLESDASRWDLIVSDPPSFAPNAKSKPAALEAYRKLHESCLGKLSRKGLYLAASCSSHVTGEDFVQTLREGARGARTVLQILERWGGAADHPRLAAFPEGDYLKVFLCRRA